MTASASKDPQVHPTGGEASGDQPADPGQARKSRRWARRPGRAAAVLVCLALLAHVTFKVWQWVRTPGDAPRIGVSFDTAWHARMGLSTKWYEIALARAGGRIVELHQGDAAPQEYLDQIDGLLLTGGGDVDPVLHGGETGTGHLVDRERDDFELELIRGALERSMPILGICRGIQILNVAQGGTLRDLREDPELTAVHGIDLDSMAAHEVEVCVGTRLAELLGAGTRQANSFHGQAVDQVGADLRVAAVAPDGVVEALERPGAVLVLATQWHPEMPPHQMALFEAFLQAARAYRDRHH